MFHSFLYVYHRIDQHESDSHSVGLSMIIRFSQTKKETLVDGLVSNGLRIRHGGLQSRGVPPVIDFGVGLSLTKTNHFLGYPHFAETPSS